MIAKSECLNDRLRKNVASNNVSFRRNLSLKKGVLHEEETVRCGADWGLGRNGT